MLCIIAHYIPSPYLPTYSPAGYDLNCFRITLRLLLLAGTNISVLVVRCIWQVFILAFFDEFLIDYK